jgi:hypothetical protein
MYFGRTFLNLDAIVALCGAISLDGLPMRHAMPLGGSCAPPRDVGWWIVRSAARC